MRNFLQHKLPLSSAIGWILTSIFVVTGSTYSCLKTIKINKHQRDFPVTEIIQTGVHRDSLRGDILAEMLGLSRNKPVNLSQIDCTKAQNRLLAYPMIKSAHVITVKPSSLYIDYILREPIAMIEDYPNIAMDEEGFLFPLIPFYSPKILTSLYMEGAPFEEDGDQELLSKAVFFKPLQGKKVDLAFHLLRLLKTSAFRENFFIKRIDLSKAFTTSLGSQEIVIEITQEVREGITSQFTHYLRLTPYGYAQELGNYLVLHHELIKNYREGLAEERVVDLRIEGCAFIHEEELAHQH